ncbi:MAG: hypothetical protein HYW26_02980 [Candidatus Aenigmarchaeota archaeon]|nr:hypothetical protein [Candidatus Aenigmarchaeota archaeon]
MVVARRALETDIRSAGYQITDWGYAESGRIGILKPREPTRGFLGLPRRQKPLYVGTLCPEGQSWPLYDSGCLLEVHGKDELPKMAALADKITQSHGIQVGVKLLSDNPQPEGGLSFWDIILPGLFPSTLYKD